MKKQKFYWLWFSLICVFIFILQQFIFGFTDFFKLSENALNMPWQFVTAIFLHGDLAHLVYNLFALIIFGMILESLIGSRKFLLLFFLSGVVANVVSFFWFPNALGASGAIMGIIGCLAILRPTMAVWAFGMILPMFIVAILWVAGSVMGIFGFGNQGTGHLAHLLGIIVGLSYGVFFRFCRKRIRRGDKFKINIPEGYMRSWEDRNVR